MKNDIKYHSDEKINGIVNFMGQQSFYKETVMSMNMDKLIEFLKDLHGLSLSDTIELIKVLQTLYCGHVTNVLTSKTICSRD